MTILSSQFPRQLISRFYDVKRPVRSPDLSPLDFLLWRYLKERVYRGYPTTQTDLKDAIESEIRSIGPAITSAVMNSMQNRAESHIQSAEATWRTSFSRGSHRKTPVSQDSMMHCFYNMLIRCEFIKVWNRSHIFLTPCIRLLKLFVC